MATKKETQILLTAQDRASGAFKSAARGAVGLAESYSGVSLAAAGLTAGAVAAGAALVALTKNAADNARELQTNADMAGVGVEAFQELRFAAGEFNVTTEALTDGLKELALRTDEFVETGAGPAAESFRRLGFETDELNALLGDTPSLMVEVARRMEGMGRAAQIRIADEIFGGQGGEQFVAMLAAGADAIEGLRREARDLGLVMDADLVANAGEASRRLDVLGEVMSTKLSSALLNIAPLLDTAADALLKISEVTQFVIDAFTDVEEQSRSQLQRTLENEIFLRDRLRKELAGEAATFRTKQEIVEDLATSEARIVEIEGRLAEAVATTARVRDQGNRVSERERAEMEKRDAAVNRIFTSLEGEIGALTTQIFTVDESAAAIARYNREQQVRHQLQVAGITLTEAESEALRRFLDDLESTRQTLADVQAERAGSAAAQEEFETEFLARREQANREAAWRNVAIWEHAENGKLEITAGILGQLSALQDGTSRRMFEVGKASAIAEAVINTYTAATGAYKALAPIPIVGPALGAAAAAAAIASGLANVQAIKSQQFGGGAGGAPAVPSAPGAAPGAPGANLPDLAPANDNAPRTVYLMLDSDSGVVSTEWFRDVLIPGINEALDDGVELRVS